MSCRWLRDKLPRRNWWSRLHGQPREGLGLASAAALYWHQEALRRAERDERTAPFLGSLLVSLGGAHLAMGQAEPAERYFALAAEHGLVHTDEST